MLNRFVIAAAAIVMTAHLAMAGPIDTACVRSDRARGNAPLCGCIQQVANQTLSRSDPRQAARFFRDPQRAQDIRQSDNQSHAVFWRKYRAFGETAAATCS